VCSTLNNTLPNSQRRLNLSKFIEKLNLLLYPKEGSSLCGGKSHSKKKRNNNNNKKPPGKSNGLEV
jgi:hypothetical protein